MPPLAAIYVLLYPSMEYNQLFPHFHGIRRYDPVPSLPQLAPSPVLRIVGPAAAADPHDRRPPTVAGQLLAGPIPSRTRFPTSPIAATIADCRDSRPAPDPTTSPLAASRSSDVPIVEPRRAAPLQHRAVPDARPSRSHREDHSRRRAAPTPPLARYHRQARPSAQFGSWSLGGGTSSRRRCCSVAGSRSHATRDDNDPSPRHPDQAVLVAPLTQPRRPHRAAPRPSSRPARGRGALAVIAGPTAHSPRERSHGFLRAWFPPHVSSGKKKGVKKNS
jgi:hypothetical protein